jgi:tRNA (guanine-N7-)-methyltransferase
MRLRNIPEAAGIVENSPYVIRQNVPFSGSIGDFFENPGEIRVEIGTGKGKFLIECARSEPDVNFIGIERYESVLFRACQSLEAMEAESESAAGGEAKSGEVGSREAESGETGSGEVGCGLKKNSRPLLLGNLRFLCMDAREMPQLFKPGEISVIYLNFSDPWPKKKHAKRRLTSRSFLDMYKTVLKDGGRVEFKTDNQELFSFSEEEFRAAPDWEITALTRDLHRDPVLNEGNIMTEYERKFSALGNRICKLTAMIKKH